MCGVATATQSDDNTAMRSGSRNRGPPHERDTRIDTRRDVLPMVLTNATWMTQRRGSVLKSMMVHEATKWMGSLNFDNLNKVTS